MTRTTALSLVVLAGIIGYFWSIWHIGEPQGRAEAEMQKVEMPASAQISLSENREARGSGSELCHARITWITRAGAEISFAFEGEAENVYARWPSGEYKARVADTCTGTECRFTLPRPGMADVRIALDSCPPEHAP